MKRTISIAGLLMASLTLSMSTVAFAQQGGGGGSGGNGGGGGDPSILEVLRANAANTPRSDIAGGKPNDRIAREDAACAGGHVRTQRDRSGQIIRYFCDERR